jgi:SAM-dependent methyltransferase
MSSSKPPSLDTPESWGAASQGYAEDVAPFMMRPFAEDILERLRLNVEAAVLEVAAGSGALTQLLAGRAKSVLATDFAPQMIDVLRERMQALSVANVQCAVMSGESLEVSDSSYDAAACSFGLMFFPDRQRGFDELYRVTRPGGRVAATGWAGPDKFEAFGLFLAAVNAAFPDLPPPPAPPPVFGLADPTVFKSHMEAAGFRDVKVEHIAHDLEIPDLERTWSMMTAGAPPVQALFDQVGPAGKERIRDHLREIVDQRFGRGPISVRNVATLGSGTVG